MGTDPDLFDCFSMSFADGTNVQAHPDRPVIGMSAKFLKLKRVMLRILAEKLEGAARRLLSS